MPVSTAIADNHLPAPFPILHVTLYDHTGLGWTLYPVVIVLDAWDAPVEIHAHND